ncbi:lipoprotein [Polynucleobacter sp. MWH-UH23A]|uniref:LPS translocon maturation chaperone LptM n=1 Tax=Polynucleobacter sp. MWH-UH23A TaxID=1855613 RepID=UPI0033652945
MIAILYRTLGIAFLIPLIGCGVRGPLYMPNVPPAPTAPTEPEPKGKLYPPQTTSTTPTSNNISSSAK